MSWLLGSEGVKVPMPVRLLLGEDHPAHRHALDMALVGVVQREAAMRAKVALDIDAISP